MNLGYLSVAGKHAESPTWEPNDWPVRFFLQMLVMLIAIFTTNVAYCENEPMFSPQGEEMLPITGQYDYLVDPSGKLTFDQVSKSGETEFKPLLKKHLGFGHSEVFWIRFSIDFRHYQEPFWFLTQNQEHIPDLQLFYPTESGYRSQEISQSVPFTKRHFFVHNYLFQVPTPKNSPAIYYMRFAPNGHLMLADFSWSGQKGVVEFINDSEFSYGLFFGGMISMWCYNFVLFLNIRSRDYLYYLYYLGCVIGVFAYLDGFAPLLINSESIYEPLFPLIGFAGANGAILFARQFLSLKSSIPLLDKILTVLQWLTVVEVITAWFMPLGRSWQILDLTFLVAGPFMIAAAFIRLYQGFKPARFYAAGWTCYVLALIVYILKQLIPPFPAIEPYFKFVTIYVIQIATIGEAILFALAIAYRLKLIEISAGQAKTAFLGMVSHELKTPLQRIGSAIDLWSATMPKPEDRKRQSDKLFERIKDAAVQLESQVKDLTDYSRLEAGALTFRKETVNLSKLVASAVEDQRQAADRKGLNLRSVIQNNIVIINSDATRLDQIVNNLLSNAIKYTPEGHVEVRLECDTGVHSTIVLSVADSGIGMSKEDIKRLFQPFTQLNKSTETRDYDGLGIGLSVVKELVSLLKGTIAVDSTPGKGSIFKITLPVTLDSRKASTFDSRIDKDADRRVLLIDDNENVRIGLKEVLEGLNYICELAGDGKEALILVRSQKFAAILLDISLPDISGFEVASGIRGNPGINQHTPIVWISATSPTNFSDKEKKSFSHFLEKPVRAKLLQATLKGIIGEN